VWAMHPALRSLLPLLAYFGAIAGGSAADAALTECGDIRALPREVAAQGRPVQLRGVVTFGYRKRDGGMVLENGGVGIYVDTQYARSHGLIAADTTWPDWFERGTLIELTGMTGPGHFAPVIYPQRIQVLGTQALSEPVSVSLSDLLDGRWDCQRVRLHGVVQYADERQRELDRVRLELAGPGGRVTINTQDLLPEIARLVDADVEVDGVMFTYFNNRGELVGARVQVMSAEDVRVLHRGPVDPFSAPELQISTLRPFSPTGVTFHRCRCTGTVTLARPGQFFYMQDAGRGVRVETREPTPLAPGDRVEVSGFVEVGEHFGKLRDAVVRKIGVAPRPAPIIVERRRVLGTDLPGSVTDADDTDGLYATLRGRIEKLDLSDSEGPRLLVDSEGSLVSATLARNTTTEALRNFQPGSEVSINGVIRVELASGWPAQDFPRPVNFRLFVQGPEDVTMVRAAPWWTAQRLWILLAGICAVLAATLGWNWLLRRRVEQRSALLAEEMRARREAAVEFAATLRERERLAADLHDTLEQSLTGVAFRLETMVVRREKAQNYSDELDGVRQLFASTREDVRRSIWNLRANALEGRTLPEAIQLMIGRLSGGHDAALSVETEGTVRTLPDFIAGNLLLLALEAVTNALKHAEPRTILIRLAFADETVKLTVEDDGCGFNPAGVAGPAEGHFGLQGMRERVKRLGGTLEVRSRPKEGSRLIVTVPVPARAPSAR